VLEKAKEIHDDNFKRKGNRHYFVFIFMLEYIDTVKNELYKPKLRESYHSIFLLCSLKIEVAIDKNLDIRFKVSKPIHYYHVDYELIGIRERMRSNIKIENVTSNGYITLQN
jgi:hypothetical protein